MARPRGASAASDDNGTAGASRDQELGSMYDYLAKIILLGPSGAGKSCLLHRFVKNEWRVLSSQTIGVEFATKIIKVGTGPRRKRIKLQLWDTAGTERFRSVSRSYYRGAAGAVLVYDVCSQASFRALQPFLNDARALASPNLSLLLVGNKLDLAADPLVDAGFAPATLGSVTSDDWTSPSGARGGGGGKPPDDGGPAKPDGGDADGDGTREPNGRAAGNNSAYVPSSVAENGHLQKATVTREGRVVSSADASRWASTVGIPVVTEASALNGEGVDEVFARLARVILTKIELGDIDPDDPNSGIQYGDAYGGVWGGGASDGGSIKSSVTGMTADEGAAGARKRRRARDWVPGRGGGQQNWGGLREWEEVFTLSGGRRRNGCC